MMQGETVTFTEAAALFFADPSIEPQQSRTFGVLYLPADPSIEPQQSRTFGVLYLLRRDIQRCLGNSILWPGAMGILAGIDLLGKFLAGADGKGVGKRYRAFSERYLSLASSDAKALYQFRNAMLHSFGLFASDGSRFRVVESRRDSMIAVDPDEDPPRFTVDLKRLHEGFEQAVTAYRRDLDGDAELQQRFMQIFEDYGTVRIDEDG